MISVTTKIVGIVLVHNEDRFLGRVLQNISEFCDHIIICDHQSDDSTPGIIKSFCDRHHHAEGHVIRDMKQSHEILEPYAGQNVWVFAVDGDEVYDPAGLRNFRLELQAGLYDKWWILFGNVLNCTKLDEKNRLAEGYLAPPCRSVTKLYNFSLIHSWQGSSGERLHGGDIHFKQGYHKRLRYCLYDDRVWERATFRCLHMCFLQRSGRQRAWRGRYLPRPNPADIMSRNHFQRVVSIFKKILKIPDIGKQEWKVEKFTRGVLVQKDVTSFFQQTELNINE